MEQLKNRRKIIDRRALTARIAALEEDHAPDSLDLRNGVFQELKTAMENGRQAVTDRFLAGEPGDIAATGIAFLTDQIIRVLYDHAAGTVFQAGNPTKGEALSIVAVGGYGRAQMAPQSDVDLLFLLPYKQTPWSESVIEYMLYMLWDLKLKVGHATRTMDECIRLSKNDLTIRTALLEARYIWGDQALFTEFQMAYRKDIASTNSAEFVEQKLAERDDRHKRFGDSRYVNEPNLKEGKGGLRDLHTLYWLAKYVYLVNTLPELVERGVLSGAERSKFVKAERFLWTVRFHLHLMTNRPEERLTFDVQTELAQRLNYTDHAGARAIERFMKHYYLTTRYVGELTRIICTAIEQDTRRKPRFRLPSFSLRRRDLAGFTVRGDRLDVGSDDMFAETPEAMVTIFRVAQKHDLELHPNALRLMRKNLKKINRDVRQNADANACFMEILTDRKDPETHLRRMAEAGVLGRFITDFGRVVAQTQHDMYHHYTVDEHTIRAIGLLSKIEQGRLEDDHPLSHAIVHKVLSRRVMYMAVFLHDIAKGRGGDHSVLGEKVANKLCPRFGFSAAETEMVAWLVRWHLAMSWTAFKRDMADPKTVEDFTQIVQSPERLRLLLILTVADIRAVGPNAWNGWKGQLLRDLYHRTEEALAGDLAGEGPKMRVEHARETLREKLDDWPDADINQHMERFYDGYWLGLTTDTQLWHAKVMRAADQAGKQLSISARSDEFKSMTEIVVYAADHPGLFARIAGAMAVARVSIVDARISTTNDGMAVDSFVVQALDESAVSEEERIDKICAAIEQTLSGDIRPRRVIEERRPNYAQRTKVFTVAPVALVDNNASNTWTVIELNARHRPGLMHDIAWALLDLSLNVGRARIATYGERAVDVFYVRDMFGLKITDPIKLNRIQKRLTEALTPPEKREKKNAA